jgi:hypothetical protein
MGVTIHFQGTLKDPGDATAVLAAAAEFAATHAWKTEPADSPRRTLVRKDGDSVKTVEGPVRGLILFPHADCEPVRIEIDRDGRFEDFTKTQFAGAKIHERVVSFLRRLQPLLASLDVEDEGGFWEKDDSKLLRKTIEDCAAAIEEARQESTGARVMVRLKSGRIADIVE